MTTPILRIGCPDDSVLAALADGTLDAEPRRQVVGHVGSCQSCLDHVGALVRLSRVDAPVVPTTLRDRVVMLGAVTDPHRTKWPAALAVAATVCLSLGGWFYAQRPAVDLDRELSEGTEQVRSRGATASTPSVVSPTVDQRIPAGPVDVRWQPTANAIGYRVRVMQDDGALVWEGESAVSSLQVPAAAGLPSRTPLYVTVTALMPDGKTTRFASVRFEIAGE